MVSLTAAQKRVFDAIVALISANGYSPSYPEIAALVGSKSLATIHKHVHKLAEQRLISFDPYHSRSITVLRAPDAAVCPLCGKAKGAAA